ncbi:hypothetical protein MSAN_01983500 [Mycena sanguinolenta]|uniref:Transmembrane protein n=1 Tax=Mycena sanguinolenta TaxID=230812 RepID=A0A8H6XLT8_9AGAR|nr:hypothetical protein MSAN_01983500 [Mycena sanguinolenta]
MNQTWNEFKSFRLGYTEERRVSLSFFFQGNRVDVTLSSAYPWRWTTPVVLGTFLVISRFLAMVNVPLSAYNIVQEFTYQPNDTLPAVFLGNLVPLVLQNPTNSFTPQLLNVGDIIVLDNYILNYTVSQAFDGVDTSKPVSAFSYYSNPLSDNCDVTNITIQLLFTLSSTGPPVWNSEVQAPCSSNAPRFVVVDNPTVAFGTSDRGSIPFQEWLGPVPAQVTDILARAALGNISISHLGISCENLIQTFYHLVRLDLGVILENQIYNSPEMFNRTIVDMGDFSFASEARDWTFNTTLMAQWQQEVNFFQNNTRVPTLEYLRSVPRLKPMGSAVTSVFVSTFAMLSVIWTVFSLVAGALARKPSGKALNDALGKKHTLEQCERGDKWLETEMKEVDVSEVIVVGHPKESDAADRWRRRVDRNDMPTRIALVRISAALKKHGLMEDEDASWIQDDDMTVEFG